MEEIVRTLTRPEQALMFVAGVFFVTTLYLAGKKLVAVWYCVVIVGHN